MHAHLSLVLACAAAFAPVQRMHRSPALFAETANDPALAAAIDAAVALCAKEGAPAAAEGVRRLDFAGTADAETVRTNFVELIETVGDADAALRHAPTRSLKFDWPWRELGTTHLRKMPGDENAAQNAAPDAAQTNNKPPGLSKPKATEDSEYRALIARHADLKSLLEVGDEQLLRARMLPRDVETSSAPAVLQCGRKYR